MIACNNRDIHSILGDGNYKICADAIFGIAGKLAIFFKVTENPFPREIFCHFSNINSYKLSKTIKKLLFSKLLFHSI